ncbi:hypothetical protein C3L33_01947, partial [Rhododendron williamsianum]
MKLEGKLDIPSLFHKFKHGLGTLPQAKWVSASGFHISLAGLLGVAGFIFALRDGKIRNFNCLPWSSDSDGSLEKKWVVPGLQNLGNNCFLNVILQALASCSCFQSFLRTTVEEYEFLLGEEWTDSLPLTVALASLMEGEAFFHILSSLREEASSCYVPVYMSLADATAIPNSRILAPKRMEEQSEHERWRQSFLGPFDGILGSILTCESCSFQISLDFQFFHSLHLSLVLCGGANVIMPGCSVEDCLRKFFVSERLDNYCCSHCWHGAAIKFLSSMDECEADIGKLRLCCEHGSCDCKKLPHLAALPWSNNFSHTFKQLNIARSPKILCIHLQRASMNEYGELIKLQGHVSFPLILNLNSFVKKNWEENVQSFRPKQQYQHYTNHLHSQLDTNMLKGIYSKAGYMEDLGQPGFEISGGDTHSPAFQGKSNVPQSGGFSDTVFGDAPMQSDSKIHKYINSVSEEEVLAAEASVLFYERISED